MASIFWQMASMHIPHTITAHQLGWMYNNWDECTLNTMLELSMMDLYHSEVNTNISLVNAW